MISVEGLKVEFGVKPLFSDASFVINPRDRIALVGKNGAGKSTMLKVLCGQQQPTAGTVSMPNDTSVGYLPQVMKLQDDTTVREETQKAFANVTAMAERVARLEREMNEEVLLHEDCHVESVVPVGFINDDTNEVGKVHLGVLYHINLNNTSIEINEKEKMTGQWIKKSQLKDYYPQMESWSKIYVDLQSL